MKMTGSEEFIRDFVILVAFTLSAFWIIITGISLIPDLPKYQIIYALGILCFSTLTIYTGLKVTKII